MTPFEFIDWAVCISIGISLFLFIVSSAVTSIHKRMRQKMKERD